MGQGLHTKIILGIENPPQPPDDDDGYGYWPDLLGQATEGRIECQYEAKQYLGIALAVTDGWIAKRHSIPLLMSRTTIPIAELADWVEPHMPEAMRLWQQAQAEALKYKVTLGEPTLLLVNDWD